MTDTDSLDNHNIPEILWTGGERRGDLNESRDNGGKLMKTGMGKAKEGGGKTGNKYYLSLAGQFPGTVRRSK